MKYFILSVLILIAIAGIHTVVSNYSPDMAKESGLKRDVNVEQTKKQAEEEKSSFDIQRENRNNVPRN